MKASLVMLGLSLVVCCLIFDKGTMAENSGWMVLVPQTRIGGEAINSGTPIPATLADKVPNEDAWIVGAYDNGYMKMMKIQVTGANTYNVIASNYRRDGTYAAECLIMFHYFCFEGKGLLNPQYQLQLVAVKAQCPNQHWEYGTALCEKEYSDFEYHMDYNKTSRSYCCERKISEECRPCSDPYTAENCTKTCQEDIEKTREECRSENDKHQYKRYKKEWENGGEWEEGKKGAVLCVLRHLVPESGCAKDGESCKENYCCDGFLCNGQVCRKDETPCFDYSSELYSCKDINCKDCKFNCKNYTPTKLLCPITCGCKKCNVNGCAID